MCINEANTITLQSEALPSDNSPQVLSRFQTMLRTVIKTKDDLIKAYTVKLVKLLRISDIELALISLVVEPLEWTDFSGRVA